MSIDGVRSRMSEIVTLQQGVAAKPQAMFSAILQEKLGITSLHAESTATETAAVDAGTASGTVTEDATTDSSHSHLYETTGKYCIYCGEPEYTYSNTGSLYANTSGTGSYSAMGLGSYGTSLPTINNIESAMQYMEYVQEASQKYGMPVNLILGIMKAESNFDNGCVSSAGASGLMQLMPETAEEVGVTDRFDPQQNILGSVEYITKLVDRYNGDVKLALAAYNTGPGKIARYGVTSSDSAEYYANVPQSIRDYADRVLNYAGYTL